MTVSKFKIIALFFALVLFTGFQRENHFISCDSSGIIVKTYEYCLPGFEADKDTMTITTKEGYQSLLSKIWQQLRPDIKCKFPNVNFKKYALLVIQGGCNSACNWEAHFNVSDKKEDKEFLFSAAFDCIGHCKRAYMPSTYLILVPKLPEGYKVAFNVSHKEKD